MKYGLLSLIVLCSFSACRSTQEVVSVSSGGVGSQGSRNPEDLLAGNATFVYHTSADGVDVNPSNIIRYVGYRVVLASKVAPETGKTKPTREEKKAALKKQKEERENNRKSRTRTPRAERFSRSGKKLGRQQRRSAAEQIKTNRQKSSYATVSLTKSFYKRNIFNPVISLLCIPMAIPTLGQSFKWMHPVTRKEVLLSQACKGQDCTGRKNIVRTKILLEVNIRVKRDEIRENVVVVENLPESFDLKSFKIKKSVGSACVSEVSHEERVKNDKTYHAFTIIPRNGSFKKTVRVGLLLDVWVTPREADLVALAETDAK